MKRWEMIETKLDGLQEIAWWDKEDFVNRKIKVYNFNGKLPDVIPVPDDVIICDFCNEGIEDFPCPVMGSYALCKECYETKVKK